MVTRRFLLNTLMVLAVASVFAFSASVWATCPQCPDDGTVCKGCGYATAKKIPPAEDGDKAKAEIDTPALKVLLSAGVPLTLVDARGAKVESKIPGALPLAAAAKAEDIAKALPKKDALIITYCGSLTCPASHMLAGRLAKLGYRNVIEYPKGIKGWVEDGGEVEKLAKAE